MIKAGLLIISLLSYYFTFAQTDIDFGHKILNKELQKAGIILSSAEAILLPDSVIDSKQINGRYFLIRENNPKNFRYAYIGRVNSCRAGTCGLSAGMHSGSTSEYFDYFILFDNAKRVQSVNVFNYQATHGHEITATGWLKQFTGHDGSNTLQVEKNIDAISGATVSVNAITRDVESKTAILRNLYTP